MKILSTLIYRDRAGNRQLRDYVKITLGILLLAGAVFAVGMFNRNQMVSQVMATPRPLDTSLIPTATIPSVVPVIAGEDCPSDPASWTLTDADAMSESNLKTLSPICVFEELNKTAVWFYATSVLGYGRRSAADILGFATIPMEYQFDKGGITVITDFKDEPQHVDLRFPSDNTTLREWRIDANNQPAVEFTFAGCFRTSSMIGGIVNSWGDGYPIVCQYHGDYQTKHYVSDVNGKTLTINGSENLRRPMWFGYNSNRSWAFLGFAKEWQYDLAKIENLGETTIDPSVMSDKYGIAFQPLPEDWMTFTGQEFVNAFLHELDFSE